MSAWPLLRRELEEACRDSLFEPGWDTLRAVTPRNAARSDFVLFGSAVMYLHGLRERIGDIDIFVRPWVYEALKRRGWEEKYPDPADPPLLEWRADGGLVTHAWHRWDERHWCGDIVEDCFAGAERYRDWPCQHLVQLRDWKRLVTRPKDRADVVLIDEYLRRSAAA